MTIPLQISTIYGPIRSRRLGNSLGINILPTSTKFCFSNCLYCQYGPTDIEAMRMIKLRPASALIEEMKQGFEKLAGSTDGKHEIDSITFSGNGEPTLHPELETLVRSAKDLRNQYFPAARVSILSDSSRVHLPAVRDALDEFDEKYMKLDAGDPETYQAIQRPRNRVHWDLMAAAIARLTDVTLQSLFISAPVDNSTGQAFKNWLDAVRRIQPEGFHIYTLDRPPSDLRVRPVSSERLCEIARVVQTVTGCKSVMSVTDTFVELV